MTQGTNKQQLIYEDNEFSSAHSFVKTKKYVYKSRSYWLFN